MPGSNADFLRQWFDEIWNAGHAEAIDRLLAPTGRVHGLGEAGVVAVGPREFRPFWEQFCATFPERHFVIEDTVEAGDKVAARWRGRLVHGGDAMGPAATHKTIEITGIAFVQVRDGQLQEGWNNWDSLELMRQIAGFEPQKPILPRR